MTDLASIQRRVRGYWFVDGLQEIAGGAALTIAGGLSVAATITGNDSLSAAGAYALVLTAVCAAVVIRVAKRQVTYVRTGWVREPRTAALVKLAVAVAWVITSSPSGAHDTLGFATTTSGTNGVATNTLTLSCVAGKRVVQGGVLGAISSISLTPSDLQGGVLGAISFNLTPSGLPNTATVLDPYTSPSLPAASLLFLVIATGFGVALGVRRFRA